MKAIYTHNHPIRFRAGKWEFEKRAELVTVMHQGKVWAMVRHKGCAPFIVKSKELSNAQSEG